MFQFNPNDPGDIRYRLRCAINESGLTLQQVCNRMKSDYGVVITTSALSRSVSMGTLRLQRALKVLVVCGLTEIKIKR